MATFLEQVTALTGAPADNTELSQWLSDGVVDVIRRIRIVRPDMLARFAQGTYQSNATGVTMSTLAEVLDVSRNGYEAKFVESSMRHRANRSTSYYRASNQHPMWYELDNTLYVLPTPTASAKAYISYIAPISVLHSDSSITPFPDELEYLVVLYACMQNMIAQTSNLTIPADLSLPAMPSLDAFTDITETLPTWTAPSSPVMPVLPDVTDITLTSLSITTEVPEEPAILLSDGEIASFGTAPEYTKPTVSLTSADSLATIALPTPPATISAPSFDNIDVDLSPLPTYTKPTPSTAFADFFTEADGFIDTTHDPELAKAKIDEIIADVNAYQADIQNELNEFNRELAVYQGELQRAIEDARLDRDKDKEQYAAELQKYQADIQAYATQVNAEVQKWQVEQAYSLQNRWIALRNTELQNFQLDIQNELNEFNKELAAYQATIQKNIREAENLLTSDTNEARLLLERYSNELKEYQIGVNYEVQEYLQTVGFEVQEWIQKRNDAMRQFQIESQNELQLYAVEVQAESAEHGAAINEYRAELAKIAEQNQRTLYKYLNQIQAHSAQTSAEINDFNSRLQKHQVQMAWYTEQYLKLWRQYNDAFAMYAPPVQEEGS